MIKNQKSKIKNQKFLLLTACCLLLTIVNAYASDGLDNAWNYFLEGDYRKAIAEADGIKDSQAHYIMGLSYLKLGKPTHARKHFNFILDMYPGADTKEEVTLSIADTYFLEGDFKNAEIKYNNFLKVFPRSGLAGLAHLRLGQSQRRLGKWPEAKQSLSKVINDFPHSPERTEAQKELLKEFYYYIQVASFGRKINANKLLSKLKRKNFDVYIKTAEKDSKTFYRVYVGKFQTIEEAHSVLRRIKADGYKKAEINP